MSGGSYNYQWLLGYMSCGLSRGTQIIHGSLAGSEPGGEPRWLLSSPAYLFTASDHWVDSTKARRTGTRWRPPAGQFPGAHRAVGEVWSEIWRDRWETASTGTRQFNVGVMVLIPFDTTQPARIQILKDKDQICFGRWPGMWSVSEEGGKSVWDIS